MNQTNHLHGKSQHYRLLFEAFENLQKDWKYKTAQWWALGERTTIPCTIANDNDSYIEYRNNLF